MILLPYRIHRAGSTGEAVAAAQAAMGTVGNPVTGLSISGDVLTVTFADGSTTDLTLPAGMGGGGGGLDQIARDAAATAQTRADSAFTSAENAQDTADDNTAALAGLATPGPDPATWAEVGNTDTIPPAKIAQSIRGHRIYVQTSAPASHLAGDVWIQDLTTLTPKIYESNGTQWVLDYTFFGGRVHTSTAAHNIALDQPSANAGDVLLELVTGTLKMYKRLNASSSPYWEYLGAAAGGAGDGFVVNVEDGRLPFAPVEMRIGWLQTPTTAVNAATFAPPATVGTTAQTLIPDFPQAFLDLSLRRANLAIWAATDLDLVAVTGDYISTAMGTALDVDGVSGSYWVTDSLIGLYDGGNPVTLIFPGKLIATQDWVNARPGGGGGVNGAWYYAGFVNSPFTAGTAKTVNFQTFPIGPYADDVELLAAVLAHDVKQIAVRISQNDQGDADSDHGVSVLPNILGLYTSAGTFDVFPGHALDVDPVRFRVVFGATALQITTDVDAGSPQLIQIRIAIWV